MQNFSVEIIDNNDTHQKNSDRNYSVTRCDSETDHDPSVLIHGPRDSLGSYSIDNGASSTKSTFPLKIHSVRPGKYDLNLKVFSLSSISSESIPEFTLSIPMIIPKKTAGNGGLTTFNVTAFIVVTVVSIVMFAAIYKVAEVKKVKEIFDAMRSPTSLFVASKRDSSAILQRAE